MFSFIAFWVTLILAIVNGVVWWKAILFAIGAAVVGLLLAVMLKGPRK